MLDFINRNSKNYVLTGRPGSLLDIRRSEDVMDAYERFMSVQFTSYVQESPSLQWKLS